MVEHHWLHRDFSPATIAAGERIPQFVSPRDPEPISSKTSKGILTSLRKRRARPYVRPQSFHLTTLANDSMPAPVSGYVLMPPC
jgi:hypothetical protein